MAKLSPMMEQYHKIKEEYAQCLLLFRLGDFYELFYDDAVVVSKELDIVLTGRDCGQAERAPMCGVPYHSADSYIARLLEKGYKVAICEQVEDPRKAKGIVKREVVRVITPGTVLDPEMLDKGRNNFLACVYQDDHGFGLAYADVSTGEFFTTGFPPHEDRGLFDELSRLSPKEIIVNGGFDGVESIRGFLGLKPSVYAAWAFEQANAEKRICGHFGILGLQGLGLDSKPHCARACGALLHYLHETQKNTLNHIFNIKIYDRKRYMALDAGSRRNLELTETMRDRAKKGSLLWVLDRTKTPMGARLLRQWVLQPLLDAADINRRLDAVEEYVNDALTREELREQLGAVHDFERTVAKIVYQTANGRDLLNLGRSFEHFPAIKTLLGCFETELAREIRDAFDTLDDVRALIARAICDEPPFSVREGGFMRDGYNEELDKLREAKSQGASWLVALEAREREATGIKNLKVRFNKVFGYYIEVTNSYRALAPGHYVRRQTLSNCERFTTEELKEIEDAILGADEKIAALEFELLGGVLEKISGEIERIQLVASVVAAVDALQSLADAADRNRYVKPAINTDGVTHITGGRHPVLERMLDSPFVPNDAVLDPHGNRLAIITGPNMAGKSTFMRQTALIALMAQMGSFIPAESGSIGLVDRIFTRVGASDDLATGRSTFMVEMSEVANILNNATADSLIILDEIGRGTSTFDGLAIAWAVLEYVAAKIGAKTLFATHYHELTELEGKLEGVNNYRVLVQEKGEEVIFLRKIIKGGSDGSYGIHVAKLAGVPFVVLDRARELLAALNSADIAKAPEAERGTEVVYYGKSKPYDHSKNQIIIEELQSLDVDAITPRDALRKLYELRSKLGEKEGLLKD